MFSASEVVPASAQCHTPAGRHRRSPGRSSTERIVLTFGTLYFALKPRGSRPELYNGKAIAGFVENHQRFVPAICSVVATRASKCISKPRPAGDRYARKLTSPG